MCFFVVIQRNSLSDKFCIQIKSYHDTKVFLTIGAHTIPIAGHNTHLGYLMTSRIRKHVEHENLFQNVHHNFPLWFISLRNKHCINQT